MEDTQEKSEKKGRLEEILSSLTLEQIRFLTARLYCNSDMEAARQARLTDQAPYKWRHAGVPIDEALNLLATEGLVIAQHIRRRHLAKAMQVKVEGLDSRDLRIKQAVATEIIEWEMGRAAQRLDNLNIDLTILNDEQLERIANGEDILSVLATPGKGGTGKAPAGTAEEERDFLR